MDGEILRKLGIVAEICSIIAKTAVMLNKIDETEESSNEEESEKKIIKRKSTHQSIPLKKNTNADTVSQVELSIKEEVEEEDPLEIEVVEPKVKKIKRSCYVQPENRTRNRDGFYKATFLHIKHNDPAKFFVYTRMNVHMFNNLLNLIKPAIQSANKAKTTLINVEIRLSVTLLYLSQAISTTNLAASFKLGKETVRSMIFQTAGILWDSFRDIYCAEPKCEDYEQIENDFTTIYDFPNCIGVIDGKHINMTCRTKKNDTSNPYKTLILMAACDTKYRFTLIDVIGSFIGHRECGE